jgi:hypothetical protein
MALQVEVFWVVTPCSVVLGYKRFRGLYTRVYPKVSGLSVWSEN